MVSGKPFTFDLSFDAPEEQARRAAKKKAEEERKRAKEQAQAEPEPPPAPTFSEADIVSAREEGYAAGHAAALAEAEAEAGRADTEATAAMAQALEATGAEHQAAWERVAGQSVRVAVAIARKVVPRLADAGGTGEIEALVRDCLPQAVDEPHLIIRVPSDRVESLEERLTTLVRQGGYGGKLAVVPEDELGPRDCRVEWADGGAERDEARIWADIDAAVDRAFPTAEGESA